MEISKESVGLVMNRHAVLGGIACEFLVAKVDKISIIEVSVRVLVSERRETQDV